MSSVKDFPERQRKERGKERAGRTQKTRLRQASWLLPLLAEEWFFFIPRRSESSRRGKENHPFSTLRLRPSLKKEKNRRK